MKDSLNSIKTIKIYWQFMKHYPLMLWALMIMMPIAIVASNILLPMIYAEAINKVSSLIGSQASFSQNFSELLYKSLFLIIIAWISWRIIGFILSTYEFRIKRDLEQHIFKHLTTHSYDLHANSFSGSLVAQTNRMTSSFERLFDSVFFDMYALVIKITAVLIVLIPKSKVASGAIVIWIIIFVLLMTVLQVKKMPYSKNAASADSRVTATLADSLANIFTIITFGKKRSEQKTFNKTSQKRYKIAMKDWYISEYIYAVQGGLMFAIEAVMIWLTATLALSGKISLGEIVLVQFYLFSIIGSLWNYGRVIRNIERSLSDADEMTVILNKTETVKDPPNPHKINIKSGKICFNNVGFSYQDNNKLFNNLSFEIKDGEHVGLVGPSGGGKSTITKLLLRMMDVQSGSISIDDQDIATVLQDDLRTKISYVPQEPILSHRSLRDNIAYGKPSATKEQILNAAKAAHAHNFIKDLPDGYDTLVGERGVKLSGGQRQRIAIARTMLKGSPVLLLDEATSALDSESEKLIQDGLWKLMLNRTAIVIAHRLSTIQNMDRILVIEDGKITEDGNHIELLSTGGTYAKLWQHQSGGFMKE